MTRSCEKRRTDNLTVQKVRVLLLIAGIKWIPESLSICNLGFFYFFSLSESGSGRC